MRALAAALTVLGIAVVAAALMLGLSNIQRGGVSCGSPLSPDSSKADIRDYYNALTGQGVTDVAGQCKQATSDRKPLVLALTIPGALIFIAGVTGLGVAWAASGTVHSNGGNA
jgi:hypothetical protein